MLGLGASIELLQSLGIGNIAAAVLDITDHACEELAKMGLRVISPREGDERSGIVSFEFPADDLLNVRRHCLSHGVALAARAGRLRISPHAYTSHADVERLVQVLRSFPGGL
jgi:selenocysteine lyase/cysteine desulfurase